MKINSIREHNIYGNKQNFKASLQLNGNTKLIPKDGIETLKEVVSRIGAKNDVIDIALPMANKFRNNKTNVNIAGYVDGTLKQFVHSIEKTDVLGSLIEGLKSNYVIKKISNEAYKEFIDLKDKETFEVLDKFRHFLNYEGNLQIRRKEFYSVEDMLERINETVTDWTQMRIIHCAVNDPKALKLCLKHPNLEVNAQNCLGQTALHIATQEQSIEALKLLLECPNVDKTIKAKNELTAEQLIHYGNGRKFWDEYAKNSYKKFW